MLLMSGNGPSFDSIGCSPVKHDPPLILIADDHDDSRVIARVMIEREGYRVAEATTGLEALALARACPPTIVLLDMLMPELDGWTVAQMLRRDPRTAHVTIIAFTACARSSDRERAMAAGCDVFLTKPMHPRALLDVLRDHCDRGRRRRPVSDAIPS